jgi:PPK2 family polyphosphate:nucleotide phosphotransferase
MNPTLQTAAHYQVNKVKRTIEELLGQASEIIGKFRAPAGKQFCLDDYDPAWAGDDGVPKKARKEVAEALLGQAIKSLDEAQELLYASDTWSLLIVLQAMDAAGKDGIIEHVMSGVNPQGCQVYSFKQPSEEELDHNFLWRCWKAVPERGRIGIFNRSYYEEVLVVRVHPEFLSAQRLPEQKFGDKFWQARYDDINSFERHLTRNGTAILKFYLHLSKGEQRRRFLARLEDPEKHWKFSAKDVAERAYWDDYMRAFEEAISATSTEWAPWYIIPADNKWVSRALVANIIVSTIRSLDLEYPQIDESKRAEIEAARRALEDER